jgi:hypothetical protein
MKTIEITKVDRDKIDLELKNLKTLVTYCQSVYDRFDKSGIPIQLEDINSIVGWCQESPSGQFLVELLKNRVLDMPKNIRFKEMEQFERMQVFKMPDHLPATNWVADAQNQLPGYQRGRGIDLNCLQLKNGKISAKKDAESIITERYTQRTLVPDYASILNKVKNAFK